MGIDGHGQPVEPGFNRARNIEKAVADLQGILCGLTADSTLNEQEVLFLDVWLRSQEYLKDDGDLIDIVDLIGDILSDGHVSQEELDDILTLLGDVIRYRESPLTGEESRINQLVGLLMGIAADGKLTDSEISCLAELISENSGLADQWPVSVIVKRLNTIMADSVVDEVERADLLEVINQISGNQFENTGLAHGLATEFLEDSVEEFAHQGMCLCFTGKFVTGGRKTVELSAVRRGATISPRVSQKVDFLVIGTLASRDWRFTSHGRKIEAALKLKANGAPIKIMTERSWVRYVQ